MRVQLAGEAFLDLMLLALTHGTALVLLTWLVSATLLRRCRPAVHAALWTVVLIKFLLPPVLPGDFGLSPLLSSIFHPSTVLTQPAPESPRDRTGLMAVADGSLQPSASTQMRPAPARRLLPAALLIAYAFLVSLFGWRALLNSYRMRRHVRRLPLADREMACEVAEAAVRLGLRRPPRVCTDDATTSPFVVGVLPPTLVMPASLPGRIDAAAREALIIHELAHIRRGDTLVRWLRNVARLLFFFWPPVWWLCRRVERFSEMACDEWAVRLSSAGAQVYAEALLDVAKAGGGGLACQQVAFASRDASLMAARFEMILGGDYGKPTRLPVLASAALTTWGLFALAGGTSASPVNGANIIAPTSEVFNEVTAVGHVLHDEALAPNQSVANAAREEKQRGFGASPRTSAPATRRESAEHNAAARTSSEEVMGFQQSPRPGEVRPHHQPDAYKVASREADLDGDGIISDFEAGYSAGLRQRISRDERNGFADGLSAPTGRRPGSDADSLRRRRAIELREMRRERTADDTP
ncbi:MAG TPA: M56 family metallopeptidase [Pyrinomonadaceae bacterium]|nr:M56 family metallopeptidase [Pyrinomonadaceae bacterium]